MSLLAAVVGKVDQGRNVDTVTVQEKWSSETKKCYREMWFVRIAELIFHSWGRSGGSGQ